MTFERTPRFDRDFKALRQEHRKQFLGLMRDFNAAGAAYAANAGSGAWPARLRVRRMTSVKGVWEMTWSFSSPDGRATFEFVTAEEGLRVRWRRIGDRHIIYREP